MTKERTKNEIISDLKAEVENLRYKLERLESENKDNGDFINVLMDIFEINEYSWAGSKYDQIIEKAKTITYEHNNLVNERNSEIKFLRIENDRFFNLIRSLSGDKTLEKEIEMTFNNPSVTGDMKIYKKFN